MRIYGLCPRELVPETRPELLTNALELNISAVILARYLESQFDVIVFDNRLPHGLVSETIDLMRYLISNAYTRIGFQKFSLYREQDLLYVMINDLF